MTEANLVDQAHAEQANAALDFIEGYANYADVLEAPRIQHEVVGIQLVAAALNRSGVTIPLGAVRYSLDLWTVLLSGSGAGRSTTVGLADAILKAAQMEDLESSVRWGSAAAFYQHFAENPCGLHVWGEMAERLRLLNTSAFVGVKEWLTDRYDNFKTPSSHRYRRNGQPGDTPPIDFQQAPRINILATSANEWFFRSLAEEDSAGGFLARWLIMRVEGNRRDVPVPQATNASLVPSLGQRLAQIGQLQGEADLSGILAMYERWYGDTKRRFEAQPNLALALAYFNRHRGHVLKLAVIFEASQSATLKVSAAAWERAARFAEQVERCIFDMLPTGMNREGAEVEKMAGQILNAGSAGALLSKVTLAFKHWKQREREERLRTLTDSRTIHRFQRQTHGRSATVYVHKDHLKSHRRKFPRDVPCS